MHGSKLHTFGLFQKLIFIYQQRTGMSDYAQKINPCITLKSNNKILLKIKLFYENEIEINNKGAFLRNIGNTR